MKPAIIDTSVYVDYLERGRHEFAMTVVKRSYLLRYSAVVLSELRRGARTTESRRLVTALHDAAAQIWAPLAPDWWQAGRLIQELGDARQWNAGKRRNFQNDVLIALTARRYGATVVTADRADFELLATEIAFQVRFV